MKEIAGFECKNAKKFPRSLGSLAYIDYLDVGVLPAVCEALTLTYLGYFASLNSWGGGGGGHYGPPKISTMDGPISLKIGTDTE